MSFSSFGNVSLRAISSVVPAEAISVEDELQYYGGSRERADKFIQASGLSTRRSAPENITASDLCRQAAQNLIDRCHLDPSEIDALLFVSHSPDYLLPASAALLQNALGLPTSCATLDLNVGCAGFVKGFWMASGLISSRACSKVLLLVGDTPNRFQDPANRVTAPVFGDAGTAALIEYKESASPISFLLGSDGGKHESLVIPGGGSRIPQRADETPESRFNRKILDLRGNPWTLGGYCQIWMDAMGIYTFSASVIPPHIRRHMELERVDESSLDALLLHQANKIIVKGIAKKLGISLEKVPHETLPKYGNLGSSSIPNLICEHFSSGGEGADAPRERVMLCAFGAGLAWGSCFLSLKDTQILPVCDYLLPANIPARDECIAYWHNKFSEA